MRMRSRAPVTFKIMIPGSITAKSMYPQDTAYSLKQMSQCMRTCILWLVGQGGGGDTNVFGQEVIHTHGGISEFLPELRNDDILWMFSTHFVRKQEREVSAQSEKNALYKSSRLQSPEGSIIKNNDC
jgi:hypothetical protein